MNIREKIQALMAKAMSTGVTDAEADAFMKKAQELMTKYGVSESDLKAASEKEESWREYNIRAEATRDGRWKWHPVDRTLTSTIARFTGCFTYVHRPAGEAPAKVFYGLEQEVELANWILAGLREKFDRDWSTFKYIDRERKSLRNLANERKAFTLAFSDEIVRRVSSFEQRTQDTNSTALVVQKCELARQKLEAKGMAFVSGSAGNFAGANRSAEAAGAGKMSAAGASLGRGIGKTSIAIGHG